MPRRGTVTRREVLPDPVYNNKLVTQDVNKVLLSNGYQGGKPLRGEFPELGESALFCITEMHTKKDIDGMVAALKEATQ